VEKKRTDITTEGNRRTRRKAAKQTKRIEKKVRKFAEHEKDENEVQVVSERESQQHQSVLLEPYRAFGLYTSNVPF